MKGELSQRHGLKNTQRVLGAFADMEVDLVLCGHDHQDAIHYIEHTKKGTVISTAGTVSNRMRGGRPSSVNSISITPENIEVSTLVWYAANGALRRGTGQVLRALTRLLRAAGATPSQLELGLDGAAPRNADELLARAARSSGCARIARCRLTRNRNVMVSFGGGELRVHEGYLDAPEHVLRAIVTFVEGRTRAERRAAQRVIVAHPIRAARPPARRERTHPDDDRDRREARRVARSATTRVTSTGGSSTCRSASRGA